MKMQYFTHEPLVLVMWQYINLDYPKRILTKFWSDFPAGSIQYEIKILGFLFRVVWKNVIFSS